MTQISDERLAKIKEILQRENMTVDEYIEHALSMVEVFERCPLDVSLDTNELKQHDKMFVQEPFNRIHPRQREIVKCFVEMPKADFIREIWIFGSSATLYCRDDSDLDVFFVVDDGTTMRDVSLWTARNTPSYTYDFLAEYKDDFYNATDGVKKNILEKGIKIWERDS